MVAETRAFISELMEKNLSVTNLVDSDFTFLNSRLARHYAGEQRKDKKLKEGKEKAPKKAPQMTAVTPGEGLQRVSLGADSVRGGLMAQGAILKVTADGTSTSPVVRGVFINERILGNHIPPPPPGIPAIEPDIRGATSIREQLDKHRSNESCASCHREIDPPGFALESFDPVGVWRANYGRNGSGVTIDPTGLTPEGDGFADLSSWQQIYVKRAAALSRGFAAQFITYATGASVRFSDAAELENITTQASKESHGVRSIVRATLLSDLFLCK